MNQHHAARGPANHRFAALLAAGPRPEGIDPALPEGVLIRILTLPAGAQPAPEPGIRYVPISEPGVSSTSVDDQFLPARD